MKNNSLPDTSAFVLDDSTVKPPIRAELLSGDKLAQFGTRFARSLQLIPNARCYQNLRNRLAENTRVIHENYRLTATAVKEGRFISPASEWVLDNYHVIDEQLKQVKRELRPQTINVLPAVLDEQAEVIARAYAIVSGYVAHTDSSLNVALFSQYLQGVGGSAELSLRELWALPLMLRCVLSENLARLAQFLTAGQRGRLEADHLLADTGGDVIEAQLDSTQRLLDDPFLCSAVARLAHGFSYQDAGIPDGLERLSHKLRRLGMDWATVIETERRRQTAANTTVRNIVVSLRAIEAIDWPDIVENVSLVDQHLRRTKVYAMLDFKTRDRYRHAVEQLAQGAGCSEMTVARAVVRHCLAADNEDLAEDEDQRKSDPGYYLIATGRAAFEHELGYRPPWYRSLLRRYVRQAAEVYMVSIAVVTALLASVLVWWSIGSVQDLTQLGILVGLGLIPLSEIAIVLVNLWVTRLLSPRHLPRLDFVNGVPTSARTFVVVPCLIGSPAAARRMTEQLEIHFLANRKGAVHFALLSDWPDASQEMTPLDDGILQAARVAIAELNSRYGDLADGSQRFFVFHRARRWNASQRCWMGWERKRGKLTEFNQLLRGASNTTFLLPPQSTPVPQGVRYVITLDADTRLPLNAVAQLVGAAAHPLNAPRFHAEANTVVEGYGILQPRVTPRLPSAKESSIFQRLFTGPSGVDPYAAAASDVYQDLFGAGSFTGKGLYDVDAFERAINGRFPENAILSHDLLESAYARCALISDIEVFEDFPSHSEVAAARAHRWARGDWQLLPWIIGLSGRSLSGINRWKMIDNLRRSLLAPFATVTIVASWCLLDDGAALWIGAMLGTLSGPIFLALWQQLFPPQGASLSHHLFVVGEHVVQACGHAFVRLSLLAPEAWLMSDAIVRTLWRVYVSKRKLLEWTTAAHVQSRTGFALGYFRWPLQSAAIVAIIASWTVLYYNKAAFLYALPVILLWWSSPLVARAISLPPKKAGQSPLSETDALYLRQIARRTWRFFSTFVTAADHWLPPDNYQEEPPVGVAHRSSPTNIGLALLTNVVAREMGWIGVQEMVERLERTLATIQALPKFRGHLYNWYDTASAKPLEPRYVSTVDSGNLAGHLLTLEQACREMAERPLFSADAVTGLLDVVYLLRSSLAAEQLPTERLAAGTKMLGALEMSLNEHAARQRIDLSEWEALLVLAAEIRGSLIAEAGSDGLSAFSEARHWIQALHDNINSLCIDARLRQGLLDCGVDLAVPFKTLAEHCGICQRCHNSVGGRTLRTLAERMERIVTQAHDLTTAMEFGFLFDTQRMMFATGYRATDGRLDESYYDLLASEARLTSFIAISKGDVPPTHWFKLGRPMRPVAGGGMLLSWSGSMFEYLMPSLVMFNVSNSLLDMTCQLVVSEQVAYGAAHGVPWGISESAYAMRDRHAVYQYAPFGVPTLGFKRGLSRDLVVAPYATVLAAMVDKNAAVQNMARLQMRGALGGYGFYEALDFTPSRLPEGDKQAVVKAYFAHHQGMSLLALGNVLMADIFRQWFHRHASVQAADLLLQERRPAEVIPSQLPREEDEQPYVRALDVPSLRRFAVGTTVRPYPHLLSNGTYAVMVDVAGSGYSKFDDIAITRWRADPSCDRLGTYVYVRDMETDELWSAGMQPTVQKADHYEVMFAEDSVQIRRRDGTLATSTEIVVSPEDDAEVRQITLQNTGERPRILEVTSYAELALTTPRADAAHPVFAKLFVKTDYLASERALLASRRKREPDEPEIWSAHVLALDGPAEEFVGFDTDRAVFIGRERTLCTPAGVFQPPRSTVGDVLDPIFSLRARVCLDPGGSARLCFATLVAASRAQIGKLVDKYRDPRTFDRIVSMSWAAAQAQLYHLGVSAEEANLFQFLADAILFPHRALRPGADQLLTGAGSAPDLWSLGISGDLPILLLRIDDIDKRDIVRQLLRAHDFFCSKLLAVDLVVLNERPTAYADELRRLLQDMAQNCAPLLIRRRGERFFFTRDEMPDDTVAKLLAAAHVVIDSNLGSLADQVLRQQRRKRGTRPLYAPMPVSVTRARGSRSLTPAEGLVGWNGWGGHRPDGREYVIERGAAHATLAPWANVIANAQFGCVVTERGGGYTWAGNSRENQLTPWANDPVSDIPAEALYLRDDDSGAIWSPTGSACSDDDGRYRVTHGQGYTRFQHVAHDIASDLRVEVPPEQPVKLSVLTLENTGKESRNISVYYFAEWVLGTDRSRAALHLVSVWDEEALAWFVRNPWNGDFANAIAFFGLHDAPDDYTADRTAFLGRNGAMHKPQAVVSGAPLGKASGIGLDPCAAVRKRLVLRPGQRLRVIGMLGQTANQEQARALLTELRRDAAAEEVHAAVVSQWDRLLGTLTVDTPDAEMNVMLNRWLLYQVLACRYWGRAGYYQAGGAFGFRDQLQDVMAVCLCAPDLAREHLLRAAARQFVEGDVQHWWHPPTGRGVRTHCSDDRLWLPFVCAHYAKVTGDDAIYDVVVPFLEGQAVPEGQEALYYTPTVSGQSGSLFEHCARAIDRSLTMGMHGMPLMGAGDWNDGMNRVGSAGKGESVWLGWFLYTVLQDFSAIARARQCAERADRWAAVASALVQALERDGWDGGWYRRAFYDDGTPLGSDTATECRIDTLAQTWSVLSGGGRPDRQRQAMQAVRELLYDDDEQLLLLFTPPFNLTAKDPGYIRGYPPGVRENGGQYSHAAVWCIQAMAQLGDGVTAYRWFSALNPCSHATSPAGVAKYKVEPYVMAADIYSEPPYRGRGGWTWYTGAAGWLYRAGVESILGINKRGNRLYVQPCIPPEWPSYRFTLRYANSVYHATVNNPQGVMTGVKSLFLDGVPLASAEGIPLTDDGNEHVLLVELG